VAPLRASLAASGRILRVVLGRMRDRPPRIAADTTNYAVARFGTGNAPTVLMTTHLTAATKAIVESSAEADAEASIPLHRHPLIAADAFLGAAGGAALGLITGGPPGAIVGAIIGGTAGAVAGGASEDGAAQLQSEDAQLDKDIGVDGGKLGEASPNQPPAVIGAFSRSSMGAGTGGEEELAAGPMQSVDKD
jgi:hypothetical protein